MSKRAICRKYGTALTRWMEIAALLWLIFILSAIPMISGEFLKRRDAITVGKERGMRWKKNKFDLFHIFGLGLLAYEGTTFMPTFQVKARLYVNFNALRKYDFLDTFFSFFLCCDDSKYHSLNWKEVSDTNVDIFEKKHFSLQFFFSLHQVYIVYRVSFIFRLNAFLVSFCTKGFTYSAWLTAGKRNKTPGVHAEIFVSWILQLFAI